MSEVKIYLDSGADIQFLKKYHKFCEYIHFPYDSDHRRKNYPIPRLALPSEATTADGNIRWNEGNFRLNDFSKSEKYEDLEIIIGKSNRRDILHLDSAYKEKAHLFLTSDIGDIVSKRTKIENLLKIKIFSTLSDKDLIILIIKKIIK